MKENNKYLISIETRQVIDGESDKLEVITEGSYIMKNGRCFIGYTEYDQSSPENHYNNLIKVENNMVTITRRGEMKSQLMLEKGRRHQCIYNTGMGNLIIGVYTKTMKSSLDEHGGNLNVSYTLDFNNGLVSENSFDIKVEEKQNQ